MKAKQMHKRQELSEMANKKPPPGGENKIIRKRSPSSPHVVYNHDTKQLQNESRLRVGSMQTVDSQESEAILRVTTRNFSRVAASDEKLARHELMGNQDSGIDEEHDSTEKKNIFSQLSVPTSERNLIWKLCG